jgi:hypothetical protein
MFTLLPMRMLFTSPRTTALNQILHDSPNITSPTIVALGATKQESGICGITPFTGSIIDIGLFFMWTNIIPLELM